MKNAFETGIFYKNLGKIKEAIPYFEEAVNQGHPDAPFEMGEYCREFEDYDNAAIFYDMARKNRYNKNKLIIAYYEMAKSFRDAGSTKYDSKIIEWYTYSAERGHMFSQYNLGQTFNFEGVHNYNMARKWYRKAARQGFGLAQMHLGSMYVEGRGVRKNKQTALRWLKKAADQKIYGRTYTEEFFNSYHIPK